MIKKSAQYYCSSDDGIYGIYKVLTIEVNMFAVSFYRFKVNRINRSSDYWDLKEVIGTFHNGIHSYRNVTNIVESKVFRMLLNVREFK